MISRRLRGALGNALVWGVGGFSLAVLVPLVLRVLGVLPGLTLEAVLFFAFRAGIVGAAAGGAFSAFISFFFRGRRLADLSWVRFGITGGVVAGVFVPVFLQLMNLLSGDGLVPMGLVLDDAPLAALFGGVAAGGTLKLAQHAEAQLADRDTDRLEGSKDV